MVDNKELLERRRHKRFLVENSVIALDSISGQLIEISFGGLSFKYVGEEEAAGKLTESGILLGEGDFCMENLPLITVSDVPLEGGDSSDSLPIRRRGMKFGNLSSEDIFQLGRFIREHTMDKA